MASHATQRELPAATLSVPPRMKAAVFGWGGVRINDVEKAVPKDDEVLIRVHASTICAADYRIRSLPYPVACIIGRKKSSILGMELSGIVESVGSSVTRFRPGDEVFGGTGFKFGTHAEYACIRESRLETKPANMTLEESAAVIFGAFTALCFLRMANIRAGQNILIYGASGSVGVFAVQLAKYFGARVTAVCSTANLDLVKSLGADQVVDYTKEDFSKAGRVYDMVVDTVGKAGILRTLRSLKRGGIIVGIGVSGTTFSRVLWEVLKSIPAQLWVSMTGSAKVIGGVTRAAPGDLAFLKKLIETGKLRTVIDKRYSLDQIEEAFRYAAAGHKRGHVIIQIAQKPPA